MIVRFELNGAPALHIAKLQFNNLLGFRGESLDLRPEFCLPTFNGSLFAMMPMIAIVTLIGAMLGLRFKVFVLLPATVLSVLAIVSAGIAHSESHWSTLVTASFVIAALQVGYLAGSGVAVLVAAPSKLSLWRKVWRARHSPIS